MLRIGSIFFALKVAPVRLENNFERNQIKKPQKLKDANKAGFENRKMLMPRIFSFIYS